MTPIERNPPDGWRELQAVVAQILRESGLEATVDKHVKLARGSVNVDVFALDGASTPPTITLVECKFWNRRVPKQAVHAFRAVVTDAGANQGLLLSTNGFQRGAVEAAAYTNVRLVDWSAFQDLFAQRWVRAFFVPTLHAEGDALIEYTEAINSRIFRKADRLPPAQRGRFQSLRVAYAGLGFAVALLIFGGPPHAIESGLGLPLRRNVASSGQASGLPDDVLDAESLRGLLERLVEHIKIALGEFDTVFGERA